MDLPLPDTEIPFAEAVDRYAKAEGISRAEVFRRIRDETGNSVNGLQLRYYQRGDQPWRALGGSPYSVRWLG